MKLGNVKIGKKLIISFALILILTAAVGFIGLSSAKKIARNNKAGDDNNRVIKRILLVRYLIEEFYAEEDAAIAENIYKKLDQAVENTIKARGAMRNKENIATMNEVIKLIEDFKIQAQVFEKKVYGLDKIEEHLINSDKEFTSSINKSLTLAINNSSNNQNKRLSDLIKSLNLFNSSFQDYLKHPTEDHEKELLTDMEATSNSLGSLRNNETNSTTQKALSDAASKFSVLSKDIGILLIQKKETKEALHEIQKHAQITIDKAEESRQRVKHIIESTQLQAEILIIIFSILAVIIGFILAAVIIRNITKPLIMGMHFANELADGDLTTGLDLDQKDELGILANALKKMLDKLKEVVINIVAVGDQLTSGSAQISDATQQVSAGASEQASSTEEISSSMEEMVSNIQQNTENAQNTDSIARQTASKASEGGEAVIKTVDAMKKIAEKISIIEEIARNTNLLALNAAIEAARAGEHGKGFAVVASEVRKLAERSQQAAGEITEIAKNSVDMAEEAGRLIMEAVPDIQKTAELVQEIASASQEQNSGAEQINSAIMQLDNIIQQNASSSEEMASMAEELAAQAEQLKDVIGFFKLNEKEVKSLPAPSKQRTAPVKKMEIKHKDIHKEKIEVPVSAVSPSHDFGIKLKKAETITDDEFEEF